MEIDAVFSQLGALLSQPMEQRLGWTLLHSVWQGAAAAAALAVALWILPRRAANARYAAACFTLAVMAAAFAATLAVDPTPERGAWVAEAEAAGADDDGSAAETAGAAPAPTAPAAFGPVDVLGGSDQSDRSDGSDRFDRSDPFAGGDSGKASGRPRDGWFARLDALARPALPWLVGGWLTGVMFLSARLMGGWRNARRLKRRGVQPAPPAWRERLTALQRTMRVGRPVALLESALARVPMAIGILRPTILLPACALTGLSAQQLEAILAHELAHIRRHDNLVNLLQSVIETLLFYHPAVWWVSRRIRAERENCCDDLAIAACGDAVEYARALANLESLRARVPRLAAAAAGGSLLNRVRRIAGQQIEHGAGPFRWLAGAAGIAAIVAILVAAYFSGITDNASAQESTPENDETTLYEGKTIDQWMEQLRSVPDSSTRDIVSRTLAQIGESAVPALLKEVETGEREPASAALTALGNMGPAARAALPTLIQIARDRTAPTLWEKPGNASKRRMTIYAMAKMDWASGELVPVFCALAADVTEQMDVRQAAINALSQMPDAAGEGLPVLTAIVKDESAEEDLRRAALIAMKSMGPDAAPALRPQVETLSNPLRNREAAIVSLAEATAAETGITPEDFYRQFIEDHPYDPLVPKLLIKTKGRTHLEQIDPLTQRAKARLREMLAGDPAPEPETIWSLAMIIANQMTNSDMCWRAATENPDLPIGSVWRREDPAENYETLGAALEAGLSRAEPGSDLHQKFGVALAKTRVLQGDWAGMNAALEALGQTPIPEEERPWLAAPPRDWRSGGAGPGSAGVSPAINPNSSSSLRDQWTLCDESLRTGDCSLVFRFEKNGRGLKGAHVLIREAKSPTPDTSGPLTTPGPLMTTKTGIRTNTILFGSEPISYNGEWSVGGTFGFWGDERPFTRYAVSDESGVVRFDKLPQIPVLLEVLIPQGNFTEGGGDWELWMQTAPGEFKPARWGAGSESTPWREPPGVVALKPGETVEYPLLVVRPAFTLTIQDWQSADKDSFVLTWPDFAESVAGQIARTEVELTLSAPQEAPDYNVDRAPAITTAVQSIEGNQWPLGARGVGDLRLQPGNIYVVEVRALDAAGVMLARLPKTRIWVPWGYRESEPPHHEPDFRDAAPIFHSVYFRGGISYGDGTSEDLRQRVERFLREQPGAFETEYVRLGKAWLDWHDGNAAGARAQFEQLINELPAGSVVRGTARMLLGLVTAGEAPPRRLEFVEDVGDATTGSISISDALQRQLDRLSSDDPKERIEAAEFLGRMSDKGESAPPQLLQAFQDDSDYVVRIAAGKALQSSGDPRAINFTLEALENDNVEIRQAAAQALGAFTDERVVPSLIRTLKDEAPEVRAAAAGSFSFGQIRDERAVEPLLATLSDETPQVRYSAASGLRNQDDSRVIEPLIALLQNDTDTNVRYAAAQALESHPDPRSIGPLLEALAEGDMQLKLASMGALLNMKDPRIVEALIAAAKDENDTTRTYAVSALGQVGDDQAIEPLIAALNDDDSHVRAIAAGALSEYKSLRSVDALIKTLKDPDPYIVWMAGHSLRELEDPRAIEPLVEAIDRAINPISRTMIVSDEQPLNSAVSALVYFGRPAVEPLIGALRRTNGAIRSEVVRALGEIGDGRATEPLIGALESENARIRVDVIKALREIGDKRAIAPLRGLLDDKDAHVRATAANTLTRMDEKVEAAPLVELLKSDHADTRMEAAEALAGSKDPTAVEPLLALLDDLEPRVRNAAAIGLGGPMDLRAVQPLLKRLNDEDRITRLNALRSLVRIGSPAAIEPIATRIAQVSGYEQCQFATALAQLGDPRGRETLLRLMKDEDDNTRMSAQHGLMRSNDPDLFGILVNNLSDSFTVVRSDAASLLRELNDPRAIGPLTDALKDENAHVRLRAAGALAALSPNEPRVYDILIESLSSETGDIRRGASYWLTDLTGRDFGEDAEQWRAWWQAQAGSHPTNRTN